jgi:hypothetical protein
MQSVNLQGVQDIASTACSAFKIGLSVGSSVSIRLEELGEHPYFRQI